VHVEALRHRLALGIAVRERLERPRAPVTRLADRRQEQDCITQGLERSTRYAQVTSTASSEGGPAGNFGRAREEPRRAELHRAEDPTIFVVVDGPPAAPLLLGLLDPAAFVEQTAPLGLPPDALVTEARRVRERRAR
jgi:hypothetical protein